MRWWRSKQVLPPLGEPGEAFGRVSAGLARIPQRIHLAPGADKERAP
jgi:hypothetical protein